MADGHSGDVVGGRRLHWSEAQTRQSNWLFHAYQINKLDIETIGECVVETV
jgi:hypothetical protein